MGRVLLAALLLALVAAPARAFQEVPRRVLALLDGAAGETTEDNDVQAYLAFPLHHLGLPVDYHDLAGPALPAGAEMVPYRGVIVQLYQLDCNPRLREWVVDQHLAGRRVLLLSSLQEDPGDVEEPPCEEEDEVLNDVLRKLGLVWSSVFTSDGVEELLRIKAARGEWFGFERELDLEAPAPHYAFVRNLLAANESLLTVWVQGLEGSEADLVVVGDWGGFAVTEYLYGKARRGPGNEWAIDPLRFLEAVFGWEGHPRVDPNVLNGRRVFFSHIDGDGFNSFSLDRPAKICGQVILEDILLKPEYAELPHTISVISAEVDPTTTHVVEGLSIPTARNTFALDHVESASHAFSHPMDWRAGVLAFQDILQDGRPYQFDRRKETVGSLETVRDLSPPDRPPRVMLWSGSCNPDEETLRILRDAGYRNMNGGDPRLDHEYPSWTDVAPPVWWVGQERRYSSGAANDYLMTNEWTPPFTGFRKIIETFKRTSVPRPLTPVDVYYHFYIAERESSLQTLKSVFDWCLRQNYARLFTSEYLDILVDAQDATLSRDGDRWRVRTAGKLRTVRFDESARHVDLAASSGVLGYGHRHGSLYVYLDGATDHVIELADHAPQGPRLAEASRPLEILPGREGELMVIRAGGPGVTHIELAGFEPGTYVSVEVERTRPAAVLPPEIERVDPEGLLVLDLELGLDARLVLTASTAAAYRGYQWDRWFRSVGRYGLLAGFLALLGWLLCRYHQPLVPAKVAPLERAPIPEEAAAPGANLEVESGVPEGAPTSPGALPAGGTGTWSEDFDLEMFRDGGEE